MNILHISAECYPIAKVGGLADVVGALPKYQTRSGHRATVVMPFYNTKFTKANAFKEVKKGSFPFGGKTMGYVLKTPRSINLGFDLLLVHIPELLFTESVYTKNDTERFLAFQQAVLYWASTLKNTPGIVHCHDHHTGLVPFMVSHCGVFSKLKGTPSVFTVHNAEYQGWFGYEKIDLLPGFDAKNRGLLDWDNCINPLAAAVKCAWRVTTVSPNYMEELKQRANGLEALVRHETAKCSGILNGIDPKVWDPAADAFIPSNFSTKNVVSGKKANKKWLCGHFSLNEKKPLVAFIGRLVGEKGADLFPRLFERVLETGEVSLLLLGSGMKDVEEKLEGLKPKFKGSYNAHIGYDEALSHKMYAGADFLLMPSRVEPCGLNQMYALHYGTVPIVSQVGGLRDTVVDILDKNGFGITHREVTVPAIAGAIKRAARFYGQKEMFKKNRSKIMKIDLSWGVSAKEYLNLYQSILKQP